MIDLLTHVGPGAQVFFAGRELLSRAIALGTCFWRQLFAGQWISHVGFTFRYGVRILLCESTTLDCDPCCITGKRIQGVQAHPLAQRIASYDGAVWIARPRTLLRAALEQQSEQLTQLVLGKIGLPYDDVGALVTGLDPAKKTYHFNRRRFFCSELDASVFDHLHHPPVDTKDRPALVTPAEIARECPQRGWGDLQAAKAARAEAQLAC